MLPVSPSPSQGHVWGTVAVSVPLSKEGTLLRQRMLRKKPANHASLMDSPPQHPDIPSLHVGIPKDGVTACLKRTRKSRAIGCLLRLLNHTHPHPLTLGTVVCTRAKAREECPKQGPQQHKRCRLCTRDWQRAEYLPRFNRDRCEADSYS